MAYVHVIGEVITARGTLLSAAGPSARGRQLILGLSLHFQQKSHASGYPANRPLSSCLTSHPPVIHAQPPTLLQLESSAAGNASDQSAWMTGHSPCRSLVGRSSSPVSSRYHRMNPSHAAGSPKPRLSAISRGK